MPRIFEVDNAIAGDIASSEGGWIAAVIRSPDTDAAFLAELDRFTVTMQEGRSPEAWSEAFTSARMALELVVSESGDIRRRTLAWARAIYGPAVLGGVEPAAAWVETDRTVWRLCAFADGETRVLTETSTSLRNPALTRDGNGRLRAACDLTEKGIDRIRLLPIDEAGDSFTVEGRRPSMANAGGHVWMAGERRGAAASEIILKRFTGDGEIESLSLPSPHPWNFVPHLHATEKDVYVAWESTPGFSPDDRQGFFREIRVACLDAHTGRIRSSNRAPIDIEAFQDSSVFNRIPLYPHLFGDEEQLWLAYRSFRFFGQKCFGWDLLAISLGGEPGPRMLVPEIGFPDTRYGVYMTDGRVRAVAHTMTHEPRRRFDETEAVRSTQPAWNHRVELYDWAVGDLLPQDPPEYDTRPAILPAPLTGHCPDPPEPPRVPEGLRLIWGDLHAHNSYSKCMPAGDGGPEDVLRFHRDVLGCQVLTLTDHVEYMSAVEFRHIMDELAAEASEEIVVLYSVEWAKHPAHHTNFLAHDRDVFDQLRAIMLVESHLTKVFARIKAELLPESVAAIRHYHGMNGEPHGVDGTRTVETYDGDVEWAMEAVQTRGDMMFRPPLYFPANFIAAGAKIGLVGGSDHSRGGPLKFCLTGFWVEDVTPEAVFASLRRRRTIACASGKLAMWAERFDNAAQVHVASPTPLMSASLWYDGAWHEPVELSGDTRETAELPCETRHLDTPLAVRVEAHPARPDWPSIIGYATL